MNIDRSVRARGLALQTLAAVALVVAGLAVPGPSPEAQERGRLELLIRDADRLRGLQGPALMEALAERLWLRVDGGERGLPVTVHGIYVARGRAGEATVSETFRGRSGPLVDNLAGPGAAGIDELAVIWPSGDPVWPAGDPVRDARRYPPRDLERFIERAALETARRHGASAAVFLVPIAADPRLRRAVLSAGVMIPMSERRR